MKDNFYVKMIDFGTVGYDYNDFHGGTAEYYNYVGRPLIQESVKP